MMHILLPESIRPINDKEAVSYPAVKLRHSVHDRPFVHRQGTRSSCRHRQPFLRDEAETTSIVLRVIVERDLHGVARITAVLVKFYATGDGTLRAT